MLQEKKSKKKVDFKELSNIRCEDCGQFLKVNLVAKTPNAKRCYVCFKISQGKLFLKNGTWNLLDAQIKNVHSFGTDWQVHNIKRMHKRLKKRTTS